jgi:hypothetical protein
MERHDPAAERPVADALRALKQAAIVPPVDPAREAALLAAFDAARAESPRERRDYWYLGGFAAAAALVLAVTLPAVRAGRHPNPPGNPRASHAPLPSRDVQLGPPGEFVLVPGAAGLPPMESGTLVRMDVPVSVLPSLGVTPPPGHASAVTADLVVAQDGLPRAVRLVSP